MKATARQRARAEVRTASAEVGSFRVMGVLIGIGIVVSGYMAYTDLAGASLVCGGVGDCDTAHASAYARLLGVPVSLLGFVGYAVIGALLGWQSRSRGDAAYLARLAILAVVLAGAIFSIYLTYVEFFVIRAVCPWCVVSAALMVALAVFAALAVRRELAGNRI